MKNPEEPTVSIIIPCYNYGVYLPATLNSLIGQSFTDWECILVNNASTDNTEAVCRDFQSRDDRFIYFESKNNGPSAARNAGLNMARGRYIQFLDADDLLEKEKLKTHVEFLNNHSATGLVYGGVRYFADTHPEQRHLSLWGKDRKWMPELSGNGIGLVRAILRYNIMTIHAPVFRKNILDSTGFFREDMWGYEDWDLWLRMALHDVRFDFLEGSDTLALVRSHPSSLNKDRKGMRKYILNVWVNALSSGKLSFILWPYVIYRIEEEIARSLMSAILHADSAYVSYEGISTRVKIMAFVFLPFFLPLFLMVWMIRLLRKFKAGKEEAKS